MDGRLRRWQRTHQALIAAALDLVVELQDLPSAQAIAERAKVTKRTVFDHFPDLTTLFTDAADRQQFDAWFSLSLPDRDRPFVARLATAVEQRALLFEDIGPVRRVAIRLAQDHEKLAELVASSRAALRRHIDVHLAPEMQGLAPDRAEGVHAIATFEMWQVLRHQQGLPFSEATATVRSTIEAVVAARAESA